MNTESNPASLPAESMSMQRRGRSIPVQNMENGYMQCWYPIALSTEVPAGKVVSKEFLNGRVVAFRGETGIAVVTSAFCRHLGADLALGDVVGDELRCVYHHWSYDQAGVCRRTAAGDPPPPGARLFCFPTAEKWGIIWAFNGTKPLYEVPTPGVDEADLVVRSKEKELLPVEPHVPFSNALDLQHLKVIHQLETLRLPSDFDTRGLKIEYEIEFLAPMLGRSMQRVRMYGGNSIVITQEFMGRTMHMMSFGRVIPGARTIIYNVMATAKSTGKPGEDQMIAQVLNAAEQFGDRLQDEDRGVMHTVSFRQDCLSASDKFMGAYLRYVQDYPRTNVACDMVAT